MPERTDQMDADTHEGVTVTFRRVSIPESQTLAASQAAASKGYHGQYISDDDESDGANYDESEDGWYSEDERQGPSSAKTTPEQSKGVIGSQQNPIELETSGPHVIDLIDDDDVRRSPPLAKRASPKPNRSSPRPVTIVTEPLPATITEDKSQSRIFDSNKVVQDSVDKDNSFYDSYKPRALAHLSGNSNHKIIMTNGNDPSVQQLGLAGVINNDDRWSIGSSESEMSEGPEAVEEDENDEEGQLDEDRDAAEEDEDDEDNDPDDSLYEPDSYQPKKQPSPELGSDTGFITSPASAPPKPTHRFDGSLVGSFPLSPQGLSASQPMPARAPFDPVRSSGASRAPEPATAFDHRTHFPPFVGNGSWDTGAPFPPLNTCSNLFPPPPRVDWSPPGRPSFMPAPPPPPPPGFMIQPPLRSGPMSTHLNPPLPPPHSFAPPPPPPRCTPGQNPFQQRYEPYVSTHPYYPEYMPKATEGPVRKEAKRKGGEKNKISIDELVVEDDAMFEDLWESVKDRPSAGTKRKANEISGELDEQVLAAIRESEPERTVHDTISEERDMVRNEMLETVRKQPSEDLNSKRRRLTSEDDVYTAVAAGPSKATDSKAAPANGTIGGGVATLAGGAVLGGMATLAFLVSPLAEKALEWLA